MVRCQVVVIHFSVIRPRREAVKAGEVYLVELNADIASAPSPKMHAGIGSTKRVTSGSKPM
jgi:hypothetical protein